MDREREMKSDLDMKILTGDHYKMSAYCSPGKKCSYSLLYELATLSQKGRRTNCGVLFCHPGPRSRGDTGVRIVRAVLGVRSRNDAGLYLMANL